MRAGSIACWGLAAWLAAWPAPASAAPPASITSVVSSTLAEWPAGPVRWLLLPEEAKTFRDLRSDESARAFVEFFWRRRDPDPATPANPFAEQYAARIELADRLYTGEGLRGSLTDRGGALVLLGPPVYLRVGRRREPAVDLRRRPAAASPGAMPTRLVEFEEWGYPPSTLPPRLLERNPSLAKQERVRLFFAKSEAEMVLREGRDVLDDTARAAVLLP